MKQDISNITITEFSVDNGDDSTIGGHVATVTILSADHDEDSGRADAFLIPLDDDQVQRIASIIQEARQ